MALQPPHRQFHPFPPQIFCQRDSIMNGVQDIATVSAGYGPIDTAAIQSESGLTNVVSASRKRSRDDDMYSPMPPLSNSVDHRCASSPFYTFLGEDFSSHFLQQQLEIDRFIVHQTEKLRSDIQRQFTNRVEANVQANMAKRLKLKDEELQKVGKLNSTLEERLKSLFMENQILKDLAQTSEATANVLRCNLEQVLAKIQDENQEEDAESCCGSTLAENPNSDGSRRSNKQRLCRRCGKVESGVLVLPCRHLCLCTLCGSSTNTCPVCNVVKTASVHVNLAPS